MDQNGIGQLFSSDFPIFRYHEPEQYVGYLVDEALKHRWQLHLKGDRDNLNHILPQLRKIDLVHYDSDKTYGGRKFFMQRVAPYLHERSVVLMDDIQDNFFFRDYVALRISRI